MPGKVKENAAAFGIPVAGCFAISMIFSNDGLDALFTVMSLVFIVFLPFIAGALTVYLSKPERSRSILY
jgi:hypothetical protein